MTAEKAEGAKGFAGFDPKSVEPYIVKDPENLAINMARAAEQLGKAASAWLAPRESGEKTDSFAEPVSDMVKTLSKVSEYWLTDPRRTLEAQTHLLGSFFDMWSRTVHRMAGDAVDEPASLQRNDKRFSDEDWVRNPFFDFIRQAYFVTSDWAERMVNDAEGLDDHTRHKAAFYVRQIASALSPTNFITTNPQLYRETVATSGANLVKGMQMLAEDIAAGRGELRLRQTDTSKFAIGENIAVTPGKVIAQNDICQVLQYEASTETVLKRPLLICPPWINKFYVLELVRVHPGNDEDRVALVDRPFDEGFLGVEIAMQRRTGKPMRAMASASRWTSSNRQPKSAKSIPSAIASAARCSPPPWRCMPRKGMTAFAPRRSSPPRWISPMRAI